MADAETEELKKKQRWVMERIHARIINIMHDVPAHLCTAAIADVFYSLLALCYPSEEIKVGAQMLSMSRANRQRHAPQKVEAAP